MNNYNQNLTSNNYCSSSTNFSQNNDVEVDSDNVDSNDIEEMKFIKNQN